MAEIKYLSNNGLNYVSNKLQSTFGLKETSAAIQETFNTYLLNFDYTPIEFDTSLIISGNATASILGIGQLGIMILGTS